MLANKRKPFMDGCSASPTAQGIDGPQVKHDPGSLKTWGKGHTRAGGSPVAPRSTCRRQLPRTLAGTERTRPALPQQLEHHPVRDAPAAKLHQLVVFDAPEVVANVGVEHVMSNPAGGGGDERLPVWGWTWAAVWARPLPTTPVHSLSVNKE